MEFKLKNDFLDITFSDMGAEIVSLICNGKERIWQNDNLSWTGHAPVLFPTCGIINVFVDGIKYDIKQHGLARISKFNLDYIKDDEISFYLKYDQETLKIYPYKFMLILTYKIVENSINVKYEIKNLDDKEIYASIGGHTSFNTSLDIKNYNVILKDDSVLYSLDVKEKKLTGTSSFVTNNGVIDLSTNLLENSETIILKDVKSRYVSLAHKNGEKVVDVSFDNFKHLLLWHSIGSKMICIEPWNNLLDYNNDNIEFADKETIKIEKDSSVSFNQTYKYY